MQRYRSPYKMREFDYIIAGGGSAGCVLAARLSEDKDASVLLIEAGGSDRHPLFHIPAGFARMTKGIASWGWSTVPQKHMQARVFWYTQAKVLGGGSTINAQIYVRGNAQDYDLWAQSGCDRLELSRRATLFQAGREQYPLSRRISRQQRSTGRDRSARDLADRRGLPLRRGRGGHQAQSRLQRRPPGWCWLLPGDAEKCPALFGRDRLSEAGPGSPQSCPPARRSGIAGLVERGRAVGVEIATGGGREVLRARREVIVSSGTIGSPRLLMLSGIGPADHLKSLGIEPVLDAAWCRRESAGPSRSLRYQRMHRRSHLR